MGRDDADNGKAEETKRGGSGEQEHEHELEHEARRQQMEPKDSKHKAQPTLGQTQQHNGTGKSDVENWIVQKLGIVPKTSLGWFRAGVGFYNKKQYAFSIQCFKQAVQLDPKNYNAFQIMARACIAINRRDEAVLALKESVKLDNPSDWQLLVELTGSANTASAP